MPPEWGRRESLLVPKREQELKLPTQVISVMVADGDIPASKLGKKERANGNVYFI